MRTRPVLGTLVFALAALGQSGVAQARDVVGRVFDRAAGTPLAGVEISIELSGRRVALPARTNSQGVFVFDPHDLFTGDERDTRGLTLMLSKDGYERLTRVELLPGRGDFRIGPLELRLRARADQGAPVDADLERLLKPFKSSRGRTVFVVPYNLESTGVSSGFNDRLLLTLKRRILTYLQELNLEVEPPEVGLRAMPERVAAADTEKIRSYGSALNALAVAAGTVTPTEQDAEVWVESEFVIIPSLQQFEPGSLQIDDRVPAAGLSARQLAGRLHTLWGRGTLLALAIAEARDALEKRDVERLERARAWLIAERAQSGPGNEVLMHRIEELLRMIDSELPR